MQKLVFCCLSILLLSACLPFEMPPAEISLATYTEVAKTVAVQLTQNALLTPSVTPTFTPEPTATVTHTPEPTPTVPTLTPTWYYHEKGEVEAPILVYYHIADDSTDAPDFTPESQYFISSATFDQQVAGLRQRGYVSIPLSLLTNAILFGAEIPEQPVVLTFDSTVAGIYNKAFPILQAYGYTGVVFVTINQVGQEGMLTPAQLQEMIAAGWEVGSRGMNGVNLTIDHNRLSEEISGSRLKLEEMLGISVTAFAYPEGKTDDVITPRVLAWGYQAAVGLTWYTNARHSSQTLFYLARYEVLNGETIDDILAEFPS